MAWSTPDPAYEGPIPANGIMAQGCPCTDCLAYWRWLKDTPVVDELETVKANLESVTASLEGAQREIASLQDQATTWRLKAAQLEAKNAQLEEELTTVVYIHGSYRELQKRNQRLTTRGQRARYALEGQYDDQELFTKEIDED